MPKAKTCNCGGCNCGSSGNHAGLLDLVEDYRCELERAKERARSDQSRLSIQRNIAELDEAVARVKRGADKSTLACREDGRIVSLPSGKVDTPTARRCNQYVRHLKAANTGDYVSWFVGHNGMPYTPLVEAAVKILRKRAEAKKDLAAAKVKFEGKGGKDGESVPRARKGKGSADRKKGPEAGRRRKADPVPEVERRNR